MSNIIDSSKRKTSNIQSNGKSHLDGIIPQSIQQQYCLTGIHHSLQHFLAFILATVRLTSIFIIRLLHDVTSAEEFLLKKSNQNFLLFTCKHVVKIYFMFFFVSCKKSFKCLSNTFFKNNGMFFVSGVLFSFSSMGTRKKHKAQNAIKTNESEQIRPQHVDEFGKTVQTGNKPYTNRLSRAIRENIDLRFRTALASSGCTPSLVNIFSYCPHKRLV